MRTTLSRSRAISSSRVRVSAAVAPVRNEASKRVAEAVTDVSQVQSAASAHQVRESDIAAVEGHQRGLGPNPRLNCSGAAGIRMVTAARHPS